MPVFLFVLQGVAPVFLLILFGSLLGRKKIIGPEFRKGASTLCYQFGLPSLIFKKISPLDFTQVFNIKDIILCLSLPTGALLLSLLTALRFKDPRQRGAYSQGSFRGNISIVAMSLILNLYGEDFAARAAMIMAFLLPVHNIYSTLSLSLPLHGFTAAGLKKTLRDLSRNPIIIGVVLGVSTSVFHIRVPGMIKNFLTYLGSLSLPLGLINIGSTLSLKGIQEKGGPALESSLIKILLLPLAGIAACILLHYGPGETGMIFLLLGAPAAVSSFIMAQSMGSDGELAGLIVMISTALSAFTTVAGLTIIELYI